jgi:hypothetical protein
LLYMDKYPWKELMPSSSEPLRRRKKGKGEIRKDQQRPAEVFHDQLSSASASITSSRQQIQRSAELQFEAEQCRLNVHQRAQSNRGKGTVSSYVPVQKEFKIWCHTKQFENKDTVNASKMLLFLMNEVVDRSTRKGSGSMLSFYRVIIYFCVILIYERIVDGKVGHRTVQRYANAIVALWKDQKQQGANNNPHPRDESVRNLMQSMERENYKRKREAFEDRGIGTLLDGGNTLNDVVKISEYFLNRGKSVDLRNRLAQLLCSFMALRGESVRDMELADFFSVPLENEGYGKCLALVGILDHGKTNQYNRLEFGACLRNKDPRSCVQGALAMYLYARFHENVEDFPNFTTPSEWYGIKLLKSNSNAKQAMKYKTQYKAIGDAFVACGIASKSKTHQGRGSAVRLAELLGVPEFDLRALGRWNVTAMEGCYLSRLPRKAMRALAGFSPDQNNFFLPRDINVPDSLLSKIFPLVEQYQDAWSAKAPRNRDLATAGFLKLLKYLRIVLLQDSISMIDLYPNLKIWKTPVFQGEEYLRWKQNAVKEVERTQTPMNLSLQEAMPHLSQLIKDQHFEVIQRLSQQLHESRSPHSAIINTMSEEVTQTKSMLQQLCDGSARVRIEFPNTNHGGAISALSGKSPFNNVSGVGISISSGESAVNVSRVGVAHTSETNDLPVQMGMGRGVVTVRKLWSEWNVGLVGKLPIREMEKKYGTRWRQTPGESKFFCRRKKIIDAIISRSSQRGGNIEESLEFFTQAQGSKTLDWLSKNIRQVQAQEDEGPVIV